MPFHGGHNRALRTADDFGNFMGVHLRPRTCEPFSVIQLWVFARHINFPSIKLYLKGNMPCP